MRGNFGGNEDPVTQSPVMLEFGAEVPAHAASSSGRAVQLPVPDKWDNSEARREKQPPHLAIFSIVVLRLDWP